MREDMDEWLDRPADVMGYLVAVILIAVGMVAGLLVAG